MSDTFNPEEFEQELRQFNQPVQHPPQPSAPPVYAPPTAPVQTPQPPPSCTAPQYQPASYAPPSQSLGNPQYPNPPQAPYQQPYQPRQAYPQGGFPPNPNRPPQHAKMWLFRKQSGQIGKSFSITPEGLAFLAQNLPTLGTKKLSLSFVEYPKAAQLFEATGNSGGPAGSGTFRVKEATPYTGGGFQGYQGQQG
jgi:hypothetical protein